MIDPAGLPDGVGVSVLMRGAYLPQKRLSPEGLGPEDLSDRKIQPYDVCPQALQAGGNRRKGQTDQGFRFQADDL
jgi:hypothetical protein